MKKLIPLILILALIFPSFGGEKVSIYVYGTWEDSIRFGWDFTSHPNYQYMDQFKAYVNGQVVAISSYGSSSHTVFNLQPSTTYTLKVEGLIESQGAVLGTATTTATTTTPSTPDPPTQPSISLGYVGETNAYIGFSGGSNYDYYEIQVTRNSDGAVVYSNTSAVPLSNNLIYGLSEGTSYTAKVRCVSSYGVSSWASVGFTTQSSTPSITPWNWSYSILPQGNVYQTVKSGSTIIAYIMPATEWNSFTSKINQLRSSKGKAAWNFTNVSSGTNLTANIINQAIYALNDMGLSIPIASGSEVKASWFIDLRNGFNSLI